MLVVLMGGGAVMTEERESVVGVAIVVLTAVLVVVWGSMRWGGGDGENEVGGRLGGGVRGDNSDKNGEAQSRRFGSGDVPSPWPSPRVVAWWSLCQAGGQCGMVRPGLLEAADGSLSCSIPRASWWGCGGFAGNPWMAEPRGTDSRTRPFSLEPCRPIRQPRTPGGY